LSGDTLGRRIIQRRIKEMVGRENELAGLLAWVDSPAGKLLWVYGQAGSGKTTLMQAFALSVTAEAGGRGKQVFWHTFLPEEGLEYLLIKSKERQLHKDVQYIWILDGFREIDAVIMEQLLNDDAPWQQENCRLIIVSRQLPGGEVSGEFIEVKNFNEALTKTYWEKKGLDLELSRQSYILTGGNPLLLSLLAAAVKRSGYRLFYEMLGGMMEADLIKEAVMESVEVTVWPLLEVAALLPAFNRQVLEAVSGIEVTEEAFLNLTELPFISFSGDEWSIHELVGHVLNEFFRRDSADEYRTFKNAAYRYFRKQMEEKPSKMDISLRYCVCLSESYIARQVFLAGFAAGAQLQVMQQARKDDLEKIAGCWQASAASYSNIGFHINSQDRVLPEQDDLPRLLSLGPQFFRVLKNRDGLLLGYHAILPVCGETMGYLTAAPAMAQYFAALSGRELKRLKNFAAAETDTYVLRHLVLRNPADTATLGFLLQDILPVVLHKYRIVTSAPLPAYHQLALGMGFWEVPGVYDIGYGYQSPVLVLDLREMELDLWLEWLVMGQDSPPWLEILVHLPIWQWYQEVRKALNSLHNLEQLGKNPLASLAAVLSETKDVSRRMPSAVELGRCLSSWLEQEIEALMHEADSRGKRGFDEQQAGKLLVKTYLSGENKRVQAALLSQMSEATYYRWLQKSREQLARRMRRSAMRRI